MTKDEARLLERASELMGEERWYEAVALLEENRAIVRASFELSWSLGWSHLKLEHNADACRALMHAVDIDPENPVGLWAAAICLGELEMLDEAEALLIKSLRIHESHLNLAELSFVYQRMGRVEEAEQVHLDGLKRARTRERLIDYAAFLEDAGRGDEVRALEVEATGAPLEAEITRFDA